MTLKNCDRAESGDKQLFCGHRTGLLNGPFSATTSILLSGPAQLQQKSGFSVENALDRQAEIKRRPPKIDALQRFFRCSANKIIDTPQSQLALIALQRHEQLHYVPKQERHGRKER